MKKVVQIMIAAIVSSILCIVFAGCVFDFSDDESGSNEKPGNPSSPAVYYIGDTATNEDNVEFVVESVEDTKKNRAVRNGKQLYRRHHQNYEQRFRIVVAKPQQLRSAPRRRGIQIQQRHVLSGRQYVGTDGDQSEHFKNSKNSV